MNRMLSLGLVISIIFCCSCSYYDMKERQRQQIANASYGTCPENYKETIIEYLHRHLYDPYSIKDLQISSPTKGWSKCIDDYYFGYWCEIYLNAKNRMGGYVGLTRYLACFNNETLLVCNPEDYFESSQGLASFQPVQ